MADHDANRGPIANRDDPIPVISITDSDDPAKRNMHIRSKSSGRIEQLRSSQAALRIREKLEGKLEGKLDGKVEGSSTVQDRLLNMCV